MLEDLMGEAGLRCNVFQEKAKEKCTPTLRVISTDTYILMAPYSLNVYL